MVYRDDSRVTAKHAEGLSVARPVVLYKWAADWVGHCTGLGDLGGGTSSEWEQGDSKGGNRGARSWLAESAAGWHLFVRSARFPIFFALLAAFSSQVLAVLGLQVLSLADLVGLVGLGRNGEIPAPRSWAQKLPLTTSCSGVGCSVRETP